MVATTPHPSYGLMHRRARVHIDIACTRCGTGRPLHAALRADALGPLLYCEREGLWYSTRVEDYFALCPTCHIRYDRGLPEGKCGKGHDMTPGQRCKGCHRAEARKQWTKIKADPEKYAAALTYNRRRAATAGAKATRNARLRAAYAAARAAGLRPREAHIVAHSPGRLSEFIGGAR